MARPEAWTIKEAADYLKGQGYVMHPATFNKWVMDGAVPHWHVNRREIRVCAAYVRAWAPRLHLAPYTLPGCQLLPAAIIPPPCPSNCPIRRRALVAV